MARIDAEKVTYRLLKAYYGPGSSSALIGKMLDPARGDAAGELVAAAVRHGVAAFLDYSLLSGQKGEGLPGAAGRKLKQAAARTVLNNSILFREGTEIFGELNRAGIEYLLLKGFARLDELYGSFWIRPVGDLDLLIRREDYPRVREMLFARGYSMFVDPAFGGTEQEWAAIKEQYHNEIHFIRPRGGLLLNVDLHWDLIGLIQRGSPLEMIYPVNAIPWFEYRERIFLEGVPVSCLTREMHFLQAIYHFALGHKFAGVKWLIDLCQFATVLGERLDWALVYREAAKQRCLKLVALTRALVTAVTGEKYWPAEAGGIRLTAEKIGFLERCFYRQRLFAGRSLAGVYFCLVLLPRRWKDRWRVFSFVLFNREAFPHWRSGKRKVIPVLQPFSLALKALREQAGRLFKR